MRTNNLFFLLLLVPFWLAACGCHTTATTTSPPPGTANVGRGAFKIERAAFPNKPGTHRVMQYSEIVDGRTLATWREDTWVARKRGDLIESIEKKETSRAATKFFVVDHDDALFLANVEPPFENGGPRHSDQGLVMLFKFPFVPGASWESTMGDGGICRREVMGRDSVTVMGRKYDAVAIKDIRDGAEGTMWFVPGLGVVKSDLASDSNHHHTIKELVLFEAPR